MKIKLQILVTFLCFSLTLGPQAMAHGQSHVADSKEIDGSLAVGLFNKLEVALTNIGLSFVFAVSNCRGLRGENGPMKNDKFFTFNVLNSLFRVGKLIDQTGVDLSEYNEAERSEIMKYRLRLLASLALSSAFLISARTSAPATT